MFSKEFIKYLSGVDTKSELKDARKETNQMTKSMYYLILKTTTTNTPKKA